jgi:hypothetical protein
MMRNLIELAPLGITISHIAPGPSDADQPEAVERSAAQSLLANAPQAVGHLPM